MAKRPKIKSVENAWEEIEKSEKSLEVIKDSFPGRSIAETVDAIGESLVEAIYRICEGMLYLVCDQEAAPDGTRNYLDIKDLLREGYLIEASYDVRMSANAIEGIRKISDKGQLTPDNLALFINAAINFADWVGLVLSNSVGPDISRKLAELLKTIERETQ